MDTTFATAVPVPERLANFAAFEPLVAKAITFADRAHAGQTRKGSTTPYIMHPFAVAEMLLAYGVRDVATICAALLHDVVEDTAITIKEVTDEFGPQVGIHVAWLTKQQEQTKRTYTEGFRKASAIACLVKLADRLHNLSCGFDYEPGRERSYHEETILLLGCIVSNPKTHKFEGRADEAYRDLCRRIWGRIGKSLGWA